ncbi:hypothetical protein RB594_000324 [Gaeumannomyces avenae]
MWVQAWRGLQNQAVFSIMATSESDALAGPDTLVREVIDDAEFPSLASVAEAQQAAFKNALVKYQNATAGTKNPSALDLDSVHTWSEVLEAVEKASSEYNGSPGHWGKIRKALRRFGGTNSVFDAWSSVLPAWSSVLPSQSEYFSIICGGLKLICGAAARLRELRGEIADALEELPNLFSVTSQAIAIFDSPKELERCAVDLYVTTLEALEHIVGWFTQKAAKKAFSSLLKQDTYQQALSNKIDNIRKCSERFDKTARLCSYQSLASARHDIRAHEKLSRTQHDELLGIIRQAKDGLRNRDDLLTALALRVISLEKKHAQFVGSSFSAPEPIEADRLRCRLARPGQAYLGAGRLVTQERLQTLTDGLAPFREAATECEKDMAKVARSIESLPRVAQDRTAAMVQSRQFQAWLASPLSEVLFINDSHSTPLFSSPSAFLCARLAESASSPRHNGDEAISLHHFCREHVDQTGSARSFGPLGVLRSLIGQLLARVPQLDVPRRLLEMDGRSPATSGMTVEVLNSLFERLLFQLPADTVVICVIDAVNVFEEQREEIQRDARAMVEGLVRVKHFSELGRCAFKLLFACPWKSKALYRALPDGEDAVLWMPGHVASQGGLSTTRWNSMLLQTFAFVR